MNKLPFYKQQTPFTCSLACLRMVLEVVGRRFTEFELSKIVTFKPLEGFSPKMMKELCEIVNFDYEYHFNSSVEKINQSIRAGFYPIVLVNPSILYNLPEEEHGHYIVIKDITEANIIINDPDQQYGGKYKKIDLKTFIEAWEKMRKLIFVIKGEKK
ncbi:MAG TPA: peptidase C39 family protein [archaeon]|nr:peptidase C39 family protein [archaeon]